MTRTIIITLLLCLAVVLTPWWIQLPLALYALFTIPYPEGLLVPAFLYDMLYASARDWSVLHLKITLVTLLVLLIRWIIIKGTRIGQ